MFQTPNICLNISSSTYTLRPPYTRQHCFQQHEATVLLKCCLVYDGLYSFDLSGNMLPEIGTCSIFWQHVACFLHY